MQNKFRKFIGPLVLLGFIASILACASSHKTRTVVEKPGWYGVSTPWNNGRNDIDGQVGYSLYVSTPGGKCLPSNS